MIYLRYNLNDQTTISELISYSLQHLTFFLANAAILPVIVGSYLGLEQSDIAELVQRTFILCGIASFLQCKWGHGFPIFEGPAGMWYGIFITLATTAPALGKPLAILRTDIELGLIIAGLCCIILGITGLAGKTIRLFSPLVNGVFLCLMSLQLSPTMIKGALGINAANQMLDVWSLLSSFTTTALIIWISLTKKGFWQSIAILLGAGIGWLIAALLGLSPAIHHHTNALPGLFPWGVPTFDAGVVLTCILAAIIIFSNLVASILGLCNLTGEPPSTKLFNRGAAFTGIADVLAGIGSIIGFIPYASAVGYTAMTGVAARKPFYLGAAILTLLGAFPPVSAFFAALPPSVGYSVMFVVYTMILGLGIKEFAKTPLANRDLFIMGISLLIGIGVMFLPQQVFDNVPAAFRYLLLNGLVDGVMVCILLEQVLLKQQDSKRVK
jgi:xanthine/uracil permease